MNIARKAFWIIAAPLQRLYWFLRRPHTRGVKCLVEHENSVLLVRLSYGHKKWSMPGGGVQKKETFEQAAPRELFEEVGIRADLKKVGEYMSNREYKIDTVEVYHGTTVDPHFKIDGYEVAEAKWFKIDQLPQDRTPSVDKILKLALKL